jgi:hypothetical protein
MARLAFRVDGWRRSPVDQCKSECGRFPRASECLLTGKDPERPVNRGQISGKISAWVPADRPVNQFADQLSPGNARCLRGTVQCGGLAVG